MRDGKLRGMKNIHIVIPDLFLPPDLSAEVCAGLDLPALEMLLARAQPENLQTGTLEAWLCEVFGVTDQSIAAVTLLADGLEPGAFSWLRADPVHLNLQRDQMILQADVQLSADEAAQLCANLNSYFSDAEFPGAGSSGTGLRFFAPHPQRWYLQLDHAPDMVTRPVSQVAGRNVHAHLPQGPDALNWHGVFNEIQMLFFENAVNLAREARGDLPVNSVWLWGEGRAAGQLAQPFDQVYGDSHLASAFAHAAGILHAALPDEAHNWSGHEGDAVLLVWEGLHRAIQQGDLHAWRISLQRFEQCCVAPLLAELRAGRIAQITLDVLNGNAACRFVLTRSMSWKLWRRPKRLAHYAKFMNQTQQSFGVD